MDKTNAIPRLVAYARRAVAVYGRIARQNRASLALSAADPSRLSPADPREARRNSRPVRHLGALAPTDAATDDRILTAAHASLPIYDTDAADHFHAASVRHVQIADDNVGRIGHDRSDRVQPAANRMHGPPGLHEDAANNCDHHRRVIHDKHPPSRRYHLTPSRGSQGLVFSHRLIPAANERACHPML